MLGGWRAYSSAHWPGRGHDVAHERFCLRALAAAFHRDADACGWHGDAPAMLLASRRGKNAMKKQVSYRPRSSDIRLQGPAAP